MNILLIGYGKMGQAVEAEALARGHQIVGRLDQRLGQGLETATAAGADVAIDFTHPASFFGVLGWAMQQGIPLVSGTTGWYAEEARARELVEAANGSFLFASNFSVGVNLLFQLNKHLARLMNRYPEYDVFVEEQHHRHKADAPSGTAISLGKGIVAGLDRKERLAGEELRHRAPEPEELSIGYIRAGEIVGQHSVTYRSDIDRITLTHEAYNRRGFALGAVLAAEWLPGKSGFREFGEMFEVG